MRYSINTTKLCNVSNINEQKTEIIRFCIIMHYFHLSKADIIQCNRSLKSFIVDNDSKAFSLHSFVIYPLPDS